MGTILFHYLIGRKVDAYSDGVIGNTGFLKTESDRIDDAIMKAYGNGICSFESVTLIRELLQHMLALNPIDRMNLDQVRACVDKVLEEIRP